MRPRPCRRGPAGAESRPAHRYTGAHRDAGSHRYPLRLTVTPAPTVVVKPKSIKDTENFLVLGMDQRPGERGWRTDTIIVVAVDYEAKQVGLLSIPR